MYISTLERKILNCIQKNIPFASKPFKILSKRLGLEEDELLRQMRRLKKNGVIRNLSAHLNHRKLGFISTLIALKVPLSKVDSLAKKIIRYPQVTHCYLRQGEYNLWVVFISSEEEKLRKFLRRLTRALGRQNILNLVTKRQFKLKTAFIL